LTVAVTDAPSAVVAITVMVDGPVGVGVERAVTQPTRVPAARTSKPNVKYIGARRKGSARRRTAPNIPSIDRRTAATSHSKYVDGPCPPILRLDVEVPVGPPLVGIALIVMIELADVVPCAIVVGFATHVAPVRDIGREQVMLTSAGSAAPVGVRFTFIWSA
jgi:hypothetical protein